MIFCDEYIFEEAVSLILLLFLLRFSIRLGSKRSSALVAEPFFILIDLFNFHKLSICQFTADRISPLKCYYFSFIFQASCKNW